MPAILILAVLSRPTHYLHPTFLIASQASPPATAVLAPIIVIAAALLIYCLYDLIRRETVTGGSKLVWAAVIILLGTLGQIVYLVIGRKEH